MVTSPCLTATNIVSYERLPSCVAKLAQSQWFNELAAMPINLHLRAVKPNCAWFRYAKCGRYLYLMSHIVSKEALAV